ncbi:AraC family transcriptional regulator ligand-binding domain-containing protein [Reyranella sp.]|uniref:AraC family transcriptional regulator n=1 Tax=Reyranella sp. TaxID=1929291 RepID=UPI003D0DD3AD
MTAMTGAANRLTGLPVIPEGMVRAHPFAGLPAALAGFGVSLDTVLGEIGRPPDLISDPERVIAVGDGAALLAACARKTGCAHFPLVASQSVSLESLGPIGILARGAASVGAALRGLILALHLHDRTTVPALVRHGDIATLYVTHFGPVANGLPEVTEFVASIVSNIVRDLCGPAWKPVEVRLARRSPADKRPYRRRFSAPVVFDAERTALAFSASWLEREVHDAAPQAALTPMLSLDEVARLRRLDLASAVRRACVMALIQGVPTVDRIAQLAGLQRRTLNRKLRGEATTARKELDRVKSQIAQQLLAATELPPEEIAGALGYGDGTTFTRAFTTWVGSPPVAWRRRNSTSPPI